MLPFLPSGRFSYLPSSVSPPAAPQQLAPYVVVEGVTTMRAFEAYVAQVLATALRSGQAVILDNLEAHKGDLVGELGQAKGCPRGCYEL